MSESPLDLLVRKLTTRADLTSADREAVRALPFHVRVVEPSAYIVREGDRPTQCMLLESGFLYRHRLTSDGARQIVSLQIAGDLVDLPNLFLKISDHNIQALTRSSIAIFAIADLQDLLLHSPAIARSMWVDALIDGAIFREWIVNIGRRDAKTRVAHLFCELALRLKAVGLADDYQYTLPMTQEQLGDAVGLTAVHVNRVLKILTAEGMIRREKRQLRIVDWEGLRSIVDVSARYLHLDQMDPPI